MYTRRIALSVLLLLAVLTGTASAAYYDEGNSGDSWETAYVLNTSSDFMLMRDRIIAGSDGTGKYYKMNADIELPRMSEWQSPQFTGHLDGNGHTLSMDIYYSDGGVFNKITTTGNDAAIRNLTLTGKFSYDNHGAGFVFELASGIIENCTFSGTVGIGYGDAYVVAGIAHTLSEGGIIRNCTVSGTVTANVESWLSSNYEVNQKAGGIVGYLEGGLIENCTIASGATVTGRFVTGGIAAVFRDGTIKNCVVESGANITTPLSTEDNQTDGSVGGIVGYKSSSTEIAAIMNCSSDATLSAPRWTGGIVGYCDTKDPILSGNTFTNAAQAFGNKAGISITTTNFSDDVFREYVSSNFDTDSDGYLNDEEIAAATVISLENTSITSLDGVKYLTALYVIYGDNSQLTALDVSGLTALYCIYSDNSQLTTLNASGCTALEVIYASNNKLTTMDVSNCTSLDVIYASDNQLVSVDFSGCTALATLYCSNNQVTSLDFSGYANLEMIDFSNNALTTLNLSGCTALETIRCDNNQLTTMNVSGCTSLSTIYGDNNQLTALDVHGLPALYVIYASNNQMTTLNARGCTALYALYCDNNQLTAIDVSGCTTLEAIYCANNHLTALDVSTNTALNALSCYEQTLTLESADSTGDSTYPYSVNLSAINASFDMTRVSAMSVTYPEGDTVDPSTYSSEGTIYFASYPSTIAYSYDVKHPSDTQYMPVTISISGSGGGTEAPSTAVTTAPAVTTILASNPTLYNALLSALGFPAGTTLLDTSTFTVGTVLSAAEAQAALAALTSLFSNAAQLVVALRLNSVTSPTAGVGMFGGAAWNEQIAAYRGRKMSFLMIPRKASGGDVSAASDPEVQIGTFLDAEGNVITGGLPAEGDITAAAYMAANVEYDPIVVEGELEAANNNGNSGGENPAPGPSSITIDEDTFPDSAFMDYILASLDLDGDGYLSDSELSSVTTIDVSGKGLSSLEGLEYFTNLQELRCPDNNLTELDLSHFPYLTLLDCSRNHLTSLDVNSNARLEWLTAENNLLTALDVSHNPLLKGLDLNNLLLEEPNADGTHRFSTDYSQNKLTALDVSGNPELEILFFEGSEVSALDLSNNPNLRMLHFIGDNLSVLDVSNCPELESLLTCDNNLTALDVSSLTELISLDLSGNQITAMDVRNNAKLKFLSYNLNPIRTADVSSNTELVDLRFWSTDLEALDVTNCQKLELLHCHDSNVASLTLGSQPYLRELECGRNSLTELDVSGCPVLVSLDCQSNLLTAIDVTHNSALKRLDISNPIVWTSTEPNNGEHNFSEQYNQNHLTALDISRNTDLEELLIDGNAITQLDVSQHTKLRELGCAGNGLEVLDVSKNLDLAILQCSENQLTSLDVSRNTALRELSCWSNPLVGLDVSKNVNLEHLACATGLNTLDVSSNVKLTHLYCDYNNLTTLDLSRNTSLITLDCDENQLTALDVSRNTALTTLHCNKNFLTALDVSHNEALTELICDSQTLTISGVDSDEDSDYPYYLSFSALNASFDMSKVLSLNVRDSEGSAVEHNIDSSSGIVYFAAYPSTITYNYEVEHSDAYWLMDVTVSVVQRGNTEDDDDNRNSSGDSSTGNYNPYSPEQSDQSDNQTTTSSDITPDSGDVQLQSQDITPQSQDVTPQSQDNTPRPQPGGDDSYEVPGSEGTSASNPSRLSSASAFLELLGRINNGSEPAGRYYFLTVNIDISATLNWQGIGTETHPFTGHFEGNGRTITCQASKGLFGLVSSDGTAIHALRVVTVRPQNASSSSFRASASGECAGGIVQELVNGLVDNCTFSGTVEAAGENSSAGGIVGELSGGRVHNCRVLADSTISAVHSAGGIVGYVSGGEITECVSRAALDAEYSGGIAGYSESERDSIKDNDFNQSYEVGSDAISLALTPSSQTVQDGSAITAITLDSEGLTSWSFSVDGDYELGLVSRDWSITGIIPPGTNAANYTVIITAIDSEGLRFSGRASIIVTAKSSGRIRQDNSNNFIDYTFDIPSGVSSRLAQLFSGDVYQFTDEEIVAPSWQLDAEDRAVLQERGLRVLVSLPAVRPSRSGTYLFRITLPDVNSGTALSLLGIRHEGDVTSAAFEDLEYVMLDENGNEITSVPQNKTVYVGMRLTEGRIHRGVLTAVEGLELGTITPFTPTDALLEKIADTVNRSADELNFITEENISDPKEPTQAMRDQMESRDAQVIGKMNTILVSHDGYYILRVTLSDDLYEQVRGVKVDELKAYVLYDSERVETSEVRASFITGLLNTWELLTLTGDKLEFGAKEFLMVGFLNAGTPFSVYLTKILLALLMGGCDAGVGLAGLAVVAGAVILLMRMRR